MYWYCLSASMAAFRRDGGPDITLEDFTRPVVSMTASRMTLPVTNWRTASGGATARTELTSLGGTTPSSPSATASGSTVSLEASGASRFLLRALSDLGVTLPDDGLAVSAGFADSSISVSEPESVSDWAAFATGGASAEFAALRVASFAKV